MESLLKILSIAVAAISVYLGVFGFMPLPFILYLFGIAVSLFILAIVLKDKRNDKKGKDYIDNVHL